MLELKTDALDAPLFRQALALIRIGQFKEAARNLGAVLAKEEKYPEAQDYIQRAYANNPTDPNMVLLAEMTELAYPNDYEGDIRMVNEWAKALGLTEWFGGLGFEEMPGNYLG